MKIGAKIIVRKWFKKVNGTILEIEETQIGGIEDSQLDKYIIKLENNEIIKIEYPNYFVKYNIIGID